MAAEVGKKVLVVDDEESLRRLLTLILDGCGHDVDTAANGEEAGSKILAAEPPYDVVVSDLQNGPSDTDFSILRGVVSAVRTQRARSFHTGSPAKTAIVAYSGNDAFLGRKLDELDELVPGCTEVVEAKVNKPFKNATLIDAVDTAGRF